MDEPNSGPSALGAYLITLWALLMILAGNVLRPPKKQKTIEQKRREHEDSIVKLVIERLKKK